MAHPFRILFFLAAVYNVLFGLWVGLFPHTFFHLFGLAQPRYPEIWACLGMVVGIYGILYARVAFYPDEPASTWIVAVGLAGKVLGPLGWLWSLEDGSLPPRTVPLILANDLVWWFPFIFYLVRARPARRRFIVFAVVVLHLVACAALLAASGGTEVEPNLQARARFVAAEIPLWTRAWVAWMVASLSIGPFFLVWGARMLELHAPRALVVSACGLTIAGVPFDLAGEIVNVSWLTMPSCTQEDFARGAALYVLLGPGIANGLYCAGGILGSVASWRCGLLRGPLAWLGFATWVVGFALTGSALLGLRAGMVATGGAVMALFVVWAALVARRLDRPVPTSSPRIP